VATNFPASLDSLTNPTSSDSLNSPSHSAQHANSNDAIEALQAKVGADSSAVTSSLDYKVAQLETDVAGLVTGKILQVVQTVKTDVFSTTSTTLVDITGLSVAITPTAATSKILVMTQVSVGHSPVGSAIYLDLVRDSTSIFNSTASPGGGYTLRYNGMVFDQYSSMPVPFIYLDSPATTSATTYKWQTSTSTGTQYVNRNGAGTYGATSSITVMEVAA